MKIAAHILYVQSFSDTMLGELLLTPSSGRILKKSGTHQQPKFSFLYSHERLHGWDQYEQGKHPAHKHITLQYF